MPVTNEKVANERVAALVADSALLGGMYTDAYFPDHLVDRGLAVLLRLCERIESERPADLTALYALTAVATEEFNDLESVFEAEGSELETVAREEISEAFFLVAGCYGFEDADPERLVEAREW
ncbi:DUF5713 family protein [Streptomyces sp. NPDC127068]|uniref:DUF5713 family protein n=1 Tax=Streptomyces sp. NPDC127068 TaxID=3347127 RepID=UPI00365F3401